MKASPEKGGPPAFFGVSKTDALSKMRKLHRMYRQLLRDGQVSPSEKAMGEEEVYFTVTPGVGEYFLSGDDRTYSCDSRDWGVIEKEKIKAKGILPKI